MNDILASQLLDIAESAGHAIGLVIACLWVLFGISLARDEIQVRRQVRRGTLQRASLPEPSPAVLSPWHGMSGIYRAKGIGGREILVIRCAHSNIAHGTDEFGGDFYPSSVVAITRLNRPVSTFHLPWLGETIDWDHEGTIGVPLRSRLRPHLLGGLIVCDGWMAYYTGAGRPDRVAGEADRLAVLIERYAPLPV